MACKVEWLDRATLDLLSILDFIRQRNASAAASYVEDIASSVDQLADFPESGRRFNLVYRVLVVRQHLVLYRYKASEERVVVVAVIDARRDVARIMKTMKE